MSTSCPACGLPLDPDQHQLATVGEHLAHAGPCAVALAAVLHEQDARTRR